MSRLDIYYRALAAMRKETENEPLRQNLARSMSAMAANDSLDFVFRTCDVDEEWIIRIENTIPHIEKAIEEQRRLIKKDGQIVRINQARRATSESIRHLARHSNMITRVPEEGENIVPDSLYVTENTENYLLYENKFIYTLLKYLEDFVEKRYKAIAAADNSESIEMRLSKQIATGGRKFTLESFFTENGQHVEKDDADDRLSVISRLITIRSAISNMLSTGLMKLFSGEHILTPPIVRTNIIKMNVNFRIAFDLFSFIIAYDRDGYTINEERRTISPPDSVFYEDIADLVLLESLVLHKAVGKEAALAAAYREYLAKQTEERSLAEDKRLAELKAEFTDGSISAEKYIFELECRMGDLQNERESGQDAIRKLEEKYEETRRNLLITEANLFRATDKLESIASEYNKKIESMNEEFLRASETRGAELARAYESFNEERKQIAEQHSEEMKKAEERHLDEMRWQKNLLNAEIRALRYKNGEPQPEGELTTEDLFVQLTDEKKAFDSLYKEQWKKTKKRIRREILKSKSSESVKDEKGEAPVSVEGEQPEN